MTVSATPETPTDEPERHASAERWLAAMRRGDFEAAWRETDLLERPRRAGLVARAPHHLVWDGAPWEGRRVLLRCEHGLGDAIQFLRYAPLLRRTAAHVTVKAAPALLPLFTGMTGVDRLVDGWTTEPDPPHDVALEAMELSYAFRHTPLTLPTGVPYLPVEAIRTHARLPALPNHPGLKIGLVWASSAWDSSRCVPLEALAPLARAVPEARFYSLQQGPDLAALARSPFPLDPLSVHTEGLVEAAAAVLALDLIITVDCMMAHLAGALGRPVFVLLKERADWRWMDTRPDSPWYPTMRLFRQTQRPSWTAPVAELADALRTL